ncbi:MAG: ABC transporter permease [Lachnoclostridium sp.]|nr:ABC transporter permease [Lachnoclostridium sp.]
MKKMMTFAKRCTKEILRDPINLGFGLGFPLVLLFLLSALQANIPVHLFEINTLTPGITVFGLSFITLFSATLIAKDRESALLQRLYTTPLTGFDFILGYMFPLLPIAIGQTVICYLFAIPLGLEVSMNILYAVLGIIPMAVFNIALGLLCGSVLGVKQVGGICGALLTNLSAWLSGVWFDLNLVGGFFEKTANVLPFVHAAELEKALFSGSFETAADHIFPILLYSAFTTAVAVFCFLRQMKKQ